MKERTIDALSKGKSVYYDATNLSYKRRSSTIAILKEKFPNLVVKGFLFVTPIEICKERNATRQGRAFVPDDAYDKLVRQFTIPMFWEGFDSIEWRDKESRTKPITDYIKDMSTFSQENKYHVQYDNLLEHCEKVTEMFSMDMKRLALNSTMDYKSIGLYHDVGKLLTKSYSQDGNAHYFNHENVSAYLYISSKDVSEKDSMIAQIINYHMKPFQWKHISNKPIWINRLGEKFVQVLEILHHADVTEC